MKSAWAIDKWRIDRAFMIVPAQHIVGEFLATFKEFPPSQKAGSFSLDKVMEMLSTGSGQVAPADSSGRREGAAPAEGSRTGQMTPIRAWA